MTIYWEIKQILFQALQTYNFSSLCTFSSNVCRVAYSLRTATKPLIGHLYEVVSLDSDWFILQEYQKTYIARHENIKNDNYLQFKFEDLILTKKFRFWSCHPPNIGYLNEKSNVRKQFLRSSLDRVYPTSNKYPAFL